MSSQTTLYDAAGGLPFFAALVDRFYEGVEKDEVLLSMYEQPEDLGEAKHRLTLFLAQYWGGPSSYQEERGHPALRMRHFPFPVGVDARDRWLRCMGDAVTSLAPPEPIAEALLRYFGSAAESLRNRD